MGALFRKTSVPDPDPQFFGPPGYRSICQRYGSRPFYQQAEIVRKTWIPIVSWLLLDFLSLKNYVNVPLKSNKKKNLFFVGILKVNYENSRIRDPDPGSGSISQRHGSTDPDPHQNVMDPEH